MTYVVRYATTFGTCFLCPGRAGQQAEVWQWHGAAHHRAFQFPDKPTALRFLADRRYDPNPSQLDFPALAELGDAA